MEFINSFTTNVYDVDNVLTIFAGNEDLAKFLTKERAQDEMKWYSEDMKETITESLPSDPVITKWSE